VAVKVAIEVTVTVTITVTVTVTVTVAVAVDYTAEVLHALTGLEEVEKTAVEI